MNIIVKEGFAFRVPELANRYRANCNGEWGCFVTGDTKGLTHSKAEKAGLTRGNFVELAVCQISEKILTFEPHYHAEPFLEIWGFPVAGEMKNELPEKASQLVTFLLHRRSKDKMISLVDTFAKEAFMAWVNEGMKGDANEYAFHKANELRFSKIFRFEFVPETSPNGNYHWVKVDVREPNSELDKAALLAAKEVCELYPTACTDSRLEENHLNNVGAVLPPAAAPNALPAANGNGATVAQIPAKTKSSK